MRKELLESAITFLTSPSVQTADKEKKIQFLEKKGLTEEEIEEAFKKMESVVIATNAEKPAVPARHPFQVIYYPTKTAPVRMTTQQVMRFAIITGFGTVGIVSVLLSIVKRYMTSIFDSIATYQSNRYKDRIDLLKKLKGKLKDQRETNYAGLIKEQSELSDRLSQFTSSVQMQAREEYSILRSVVDNLNATLKTLPQFSPAAHEASTDMLLPTYIKRKGDDPVIQSLRSEIRSFKGTLLSRQNFPAINTSQWKNPVTQPLQTSSQSDLYHPRRKRSFRSELPSGFEEKS